MNTIAPTTHHTTILGLTPRSVSLAGLADGVLGGLALVTAFVTSILALVALAGATGAMITPF